MECPTPRNGRSCKSRRCPACSVLWAGDWRISLFANWDAYKAQVQLVTVTAPGSDVLPWDESACSHGLGVPCSGKRGCQLRADELGRWNAAAPANWSRMHRAVAQRCRRRGMKLHVLGYVWQVQKRGALHIHVVLGLRTAANRHAARQYQLRLAAVSQEYGFGYVDRKWSSARGQRVAAYLSSYLITGHGRESAVQEVVKLDRAPARIVYVSRLLTDVTGYTMRTLRRRRYLWHLWQTKAAVLVDDWIVDVFTGECMARADVLKL